MTEQQKDVEVLLERLASNQDRLLEEIRKVLHNDLCTLYKSDSKGESLFEGLK